MSTRACRPPVTAEPMIRPTMIAVRDTGDTTRRSKKPVMSSMAVSVPAVRPPKRTACVIAAGSRNWRKESTSGKSVELHDLAHGRRVHGGHEDREHQPDTPHVGLADRPVDAAPSERGDLGEVLPEPERGPRHARAGHDDGRHDPSASRPRGLRARRPRAAGRWPRRTRRRGSGASSSRWSTCTPASPSARGGRRRRPAVRRGGRWRARRPGPAGRRRSAAAPARPGRAGRCGTVIDQRVRPDRRLERGGRAVAHDPAVVDDRDAAGQLVGLVEVLRREEHGGALAVEPADLLPHRQAARGVEAGGGLVEEQHGRLVHEGQREVEAPLHAARVLADPAVGRAREAHPGEELVAADGGPRPSGCRGGRPGGGSARGRSSAGRWRWPAGPRRCCGARRRPGGRRRSRPRGRCPPWGAGAW